jgi:hypothetical protein
VAFAAGLKSRHGQSGIQFTVGPDGTPSTASAPVVGRTFNSIFEGEEAAAPPVRVAEQLQVNQGVVVYRTWSYVSWSWQIERMKTLMRPALQAVHGTVSFATQRLEYLDRFRFEGDITEMDVRSVMRQGSSFITPHVFARTDLWHSHTGAFLPPTNGTKHLVQVHIDALDEPAVVAPGVAQTRFINIMTALEDRFPVDNPDEVDHSVDDIFDRFVSQHSESKEFIASVITDGMAERIYLRGN